MYPAVMSQVYSLQVQKNQEFNASTTIPSKFRIHHQHFVAANPVVITALLWVFVAANSSRY